jgi:hypothetical protein
MDALESLSENVGGLIAHCEPRTRSKIQTCFSTIPRTGRGFHPWLLRTSFLLVAAGVPRDNAISVFLEASALSEQARKVSREEITRAIDGAIRLRGIANPPKLRGKKLNTSGASKQNLGKLPNVEMIWATARNGWRELSYRADSPIDPSTRSSGTILIGLFGFGTLIGSARRVDQLHVRCVTDQSDQLSDQSFVCPNPLRSRNGGKTQSNIRELHFMIPEWDLSDDADDLRPIAILYKEMRVELSLSAFDFGAILLRHLEVQFPQIPLRLVVNSGNKSLHGWFDVRDITGEEVERFSEYALSLGCDNLISDPSHWVRMPNGTRRNEVGVNLLIKQSAVYFAPLFPLSDDASVLPVEGRLTTGSQDEAGLWLADWQDEIAAGLNDYTAETLVPRLAHRVSLPVAEPIAVSLLSQKNGLGSASKELAEELRHFRVRWKAWIDAFPDTLTDFERQAWEQICLGQVPNCATQLKIERTLEGFRIVRSLAMSGRYTRRGTFFVCTDDLAMRIGQPYSRNRYKVGAAILATLSSVGVIKNVAPYSYTCRKCREFVWNSLRPPCELGDKASTHKP